MLGVDIVYIDRIKKVYNRFGSKFLDEFLTDDEKSANITVEYLAKCWAVKEAAMKASGILDPKKFAYAKNNRVPYVKTDCPGNWHLSVSDERDIVVAVVMRM